MVELVKLTQLFLIVRWCRLQELNPRPIDYKSTALPTELSRLLKFENMFKNLSIFIGNVGIGQEII